MVFPTRKYPTSDVWDESDEGDTWTTLKRAVATHQKRRRLIVDFIADERLIVDSIEDERETTYTMSSCKARISDVWGIF